MIKNRLFLKLFTLVLLLAPLVSFAQYVKPSNTGLPDADLADVIENIMNWLLGIIGIIGIIGFVIAGIYYLTAAGDDSKMEMGKNSMKWSIVGVIVALVGFIIIQAVDTMLTGSSALF